ncbi:hypothetical protein ACIO6T_41855 [Streptomyces sp. NPDC087532]|uniref:hypothetical protein n=1 Tax=unclassified Streptomyces TaxID=2593676 RepID=UPI00331D3AA1
MRTLARRKPALETTHRPELRAVLKTAAVHATAGRRPAYGSRHPQAGAAREDTHRLHRRLIFEHLAGPDGFDLHPPEPRITLLYLIRTFTN